MGFLLVFVGPLRLSTKLGVTVENADTLGVPGFVTPVTPFLKYIPHFLEVLHFSRKTCYVENAKSIYIFLVTVVTK